MPSGSTCNKRHSMSASVHRRIEQPVTCGSVLQMPKRRSVPIKQPPKEPSTNRKLYQPKTSASDNKYSQPQLNSVLHQAYEIKVLEARSNTGAKSEGNSDSGASFRATIAPLVTQKLNFNAGQTVFKNLTPINVNDSLFLPRERLPLRSQYIKSASKLPVPKLGDFLDPLPTLTHQIPEPDISQEFPAHNFDCYGAVKQLVN